MFGWVIVLRQLHFHIYYLFVDHSEVYFYLGQMCSQDLPSSSGSASGIPTVDNEQ
jgi:hypothetical protein